MCNSFVTWSGVCWVGSSLKNTRGELVQIMARCRVWPWEFLGQSWCHCLEYQQTLSWVITHRIWNHCMLGLELERNARTSCRHTHLMWMQDWIFPRQLLLEWRGGIVRSCEPQWRYCLQGENQWRSSSFPSVVET